MQLRDWYQTYREHPAWANIENAIKAASDYEGNDADEQDKLDHIRLTMTAVLQLRNAPTIMVGPQMLQTLQNTVNQNIHAPLAQWASTNNATQLTQAHTNLHSVLDIVRGWPKSEKDNLRSAAATLREAVKATTEHTESITALTDEVKTDLNTQLENVQQQMDHRDEESIAKFNELDNRIAGSNETLSNLDERLDTLIEQQQTRFDTPQQDRMSDFEESLERHREAMKKELDRSQERTNATIDEQRAAGEALLEKMEEIKRKTQEISSVVATSTTSEAYQIEANSQKRNADWMRGIAICLFIAAAAVTIWWIWQLDPD